MMSKKMWMKAVVAVELLPLVLPVVVSWAVIASAADQPAAQAAPTTPSAPPAVAQAVPVPAPVKAAAAPQINNDARFLSYEDFNLAVLNPSIMADREDSADENSPIKGAVLRGRIKAGCEDHLIITNSAEEPSAVNGKSNFGFMVYYDGKDVSCLQRPTSCSASTCTSLSANPHASMDISHLKDGNIGLIYVDQNDDTGKQGVMSTKFAPIGDAISFKSKATRDAEMRDRIEQARLARNAENERRYHNCRGSLDDIDVATKALNELIRDTHMAADEANRRRTELGHIEFQLAQKQVQRELDGLSARAHKVKDSDDSADISDKLVQFSKDHENFKDGAIKVQEELYKAIDDDMTDALSARRHILDNLMSMDISGAQLKRYKALGAGLDIAEQAQKIQNATLACQAQQSLSAQWSCQKGIQALLKQNQKLITDAQKAAAAACRNTKQNGSADACTDATANVQAAAQLNSLMFQTANEQLQQARQEQAQMAQQTAQWNNMLMGSAYNINGMNNGGSPFNNGSSFGASAPFGNPNGFGSMGGFGNSQLAFGSPGMISPNGFGSANPFAPWQGGSAGAFGVNRNAVGPQASR